MAVEDLANTPAERAAGYKNEALDLSDAKEVTVGGEGHIIILGAGLVGSLCAVVLLKKGFKVHLYDTQLAN